MKLLAAAFVSIVLVQSALAGTMRGKILDKATGAPAVGATVVVASDAIKTEQVALADEHGEYVVPSLPAGKYTVTVHYYDDTQTRSNVVVSAKDALVNINVDSSRPKSEIIVIKDTVSCCTCGEAMPAHAIWTRPLFQSVLHEALHR